MNIVRRIIEILTDRAVPIVGSLFATRLETLAALEQAEQQDELEDRARRFEEDGKPHLAAALRAQASRINPDSPGAYGLAVIRRLDQEHSDSAESIPLLEDHASGNGQQETSNPPSPKKSPRRRTRRSSSHGNSSKNGIEE